MNILITGNLSSIALPLARTLAKEKHKIILVAEDVDALRVDIKGAKTHSINPADIEFRDILASYKFDSAIFVSSREELLDVQKAKIGGQLDGLRNTLELCQKDIVKQFFYISSSEVYGGLSDALESDEPKPASINGHTLFSGEQYCKLYADQFKMNITVLRVPFVFGSDENNVILYKLVQDCINHTEVTLPASSETECSFLHTLDIADFFLRAMDDSHNIGYEVINLSSSRKLTFSDLANMLGEMFPSVGFKFSDTGSVYTRPVSVNAAKELYDWVDLHELKDELSGYADSLEKEPIHKDKGFGATLTNSTAFPVILKWVELLLGAVLMQFLSEFTGTLIQFKYIDFRLLFVVLMGLIYGIRFGLFASILASVSVLYTWYDLGYDWALLAYNVGNWFPFAIYFAAGIITGYHRDKTENTIEYERKQKELIYDKYQFLYGVFEEVRNLKDEFREQLIGYRNSFGKIYSIIRELNTLQEQEIYIKALSILEDVLENETVAIYSLDLNRNFARLQAHSEKLNERISNSLNFSEYSEAKKKIDQGEIFINTNLLPNYPAYIAPIMSNAYPFNVPVALVVVWDAKYEQYSTNYYNLFKISSNLIQDSLVRATTFMNMNYEKRYVSSTNILTYEAFLDTLRIREEGKKKKMTDYQLLMIHENEEDFHEFSTKLMYGIRAVDTVGVWSDGTHYVLLSQADTTAAKVTVKRLETLGIKSEIVSGSMLILKVQE